MQICHRNRDGSFATQSNRREMLSLFTKQLRESGYKVNRLGPSDLKGRHVNALVKKWQSEQKALVRLKTEWLYYDGFLKRLGNLK